MFMSHTKKNMFLLCGVCVCSLTVHSAKGDSILTTISEKEEDVDTNQM